MIIKCSNTKWLFLGVLFIFNQLSAQKINEYFEKIRNNEAELTAFISQMPKGGDLHNHYSGAIYAESYVNWLIDEDYCINLQTLETAIPNSNGVCPAAEFLKLSAVKAMMKSTQFEELKGDLVRLWSTKDHDQLHKDSRADHFFSTFGKFSIASGLNYGRGLNQLKKRAISENVSYIETMLTSIKLKKNAIQVSIADDPDTIKYYNGKFEAFGTARNPADLKPLLKGLYATIISQLPVVKAANDYNHFIDSLHAVFVGDDSLFTMRFQAFIIRTNEPLITLINLITAFEAVNRSVSKNLVGVNIVAPEHYPVSMRDYWLHMQFFAFCHDIYPGVKYTLHAGELAEGLVEPEELTWHIASAVYDAGAKRIGHGVDIAYEKNNYDLLRYMSANHIPVEINLVSNEFILGVKDDKHPVLLYKRFNVPIVISTDDPGVSRSSLTEQYVLLAKRYKALSYDDIKTFIYNSITYSFINEPKLREKLKKDLDKRFFEFENYVMFKKG